MTPGAPDTTLPFAKGLFFGLLEEEELFPYPAPRPDEADTLPLLLEPVDRFLAERVDPAAIDQAGEVPADILKGVAELGLMGLIVPEEYGGLGLSMTAYARVMEHLARHDASVAIHIGCHQSIGMKALLLHGTEEQKAKWLPRCATGELVCAYALTEPGSGSDAAAMTTTGRSDADRKVWVLNGRKQWITNGGYADLITVFARTPVERNGKVEEKITAFLVERTLPGVSSGKPEKKLGIRGSSTTDIVLEECPVPAFNVLGDVGRGFKIAMEVLNTGRLTLASGSIGGSKEMLKVALAHAESRRAFGRPIVEYEMIEEKFAEMAVNLYAMESMTYLTTGMVDRGAPDFAVESAMCKVFCSERYWDNVNHALQVAAGNGYMAEYPYERFLRDARINLIFEGTNEILRLFIALSGLQKPGEYLKEVGQALHAPVKAFGLLQGYVARHIQRAVAPPEVKRVAPPLARDAARLSRLTMQFADQCEAVLRAHGRKIVEREYLQKRLADAAIDLYAVAASLSRASARVEAVGEEAAADHVRLAHTFTNLAVRRIRRNLRMIERNSDRRFHEVVTWLRQAGEYRLEG
jgi:acyl-CoA dehydrogenase family protein 9